MREWLTLPNLFTCLRIALAPVVVSDMFSGHATRALIIFFFAGLTDMVDGAIARRFGSSSAVGAYLDPIADKCLLCTVYVALAIAGVAPWWFVAIVFARDVLILASAATLMATIGQRKFPPSRWGKLSTFFQIAASLALMVRNAAPQDWVVATAVALVWASATFTCVSGLHYAWRTVQMLRTPRTAA